MLEFLRTAAVTLACTFSVGIPCEPLQAEYSRLLFRHALYNFYPVESGTFQMFPYAPFGSRKPLLSRIAEILKLPDPATEAERRRMAGIYLHFWKDFPGLVRQARLKPGTYDLPGVDKAWEQMSDATDEAEKANDKARVDSLRKEFASVIDTGFADRKKTFKITALHLALAQTPLLRVNAELGYYPLVRDLEMQETGFISDKLLDMILEIDGEIRKNPDGFVPLPTLTGNGKRPYGDLNYYYWDLEDAGVAGLRAEGEEDKGNKRRIFSAAQEAALDKALSELPLVMQALSLYGTFDDEKKAEGGASK